MVIIANVKKNIKTIRFTAGTLLIYIVILILTAIEYLTLSKYYFQYDYYDETCNVFICDD